LGAAISLLGVNRLVVAGVLSSTFGLFLAEQVGDSAQIAGLTIGVASLTGMALGANSLISMAAAPILGSLSDRMDNRWQAAAGGLIPGMLGFGLLALGPPLSFFVAIPLTAVSGGSNQSLSTTLVGDLSTEQQRGRRLGILFTIGDLTSAIGPPMAYSLLPQLGLQTVYLLSMGLLAAMFLVALRWATRKLPLAYHR
jgi:MFS family permease